MIYGFSEQEWVDAYDEAKKTELNAKRSGALSGNADEMTKFSGNFIGHLGEIAVARLSNCRYHGTRDLKERHTHGDVAFSEVQSSTRTNRALILNAADVRDRPLRPYVGVTIDTSRRVARINGWIQARSAPQVAEWYESRFGEKCLRVLPEKMKEPTELFWLMRRFEDYLEIGGKGGVPGFVKACELRGYTQELESCRTILGVDFVARVVKI